MLFVEPDIGDDSHGSESGNLIDGDVSVGSGVDESRRENSA